MMQVCALGNATPLGGVLRHVLEVRPQRAFRLERLVCACAMQHLLSWEIEAIIIRGEVLALNLPAAVLALSALPCMFDLRLRVNDSLSVVVRWRDPVPRLPVYLTPHQARHPKYRGAWWVTRTRPADPAIYLAALGDT